MGHYDWCNRFFFLFFLFSRNRCLKCFLASLRRDTLLESCPDLLNLESTILAAQLPLFTIAAFEKLENFYKITCLLEINSCRIGDNLAHSLVLVCECKSAHDKFFKVSAELLGRLVTTHLGLQSLKVTQFLHQNLSGCVGISTRFFITELETGLDSVKLAVIGHYDVGFSHF